MKKKGCTRSGTQYQIKQGAAKPRSTGQKARQILNEVLGTGMPTGIWFRVPFDYDTLATDNNIYQLFQQSDGVPLDEEDFFKILLAAGLIQQKEKGKKIMSKVANGVEKMKEEYRNCLLESGDLRVEESSTSRVWRFVARKVREKNGPALPKLTRKTLEEQSRRSSQPPAAQPIRKVLLLAVCQDTRLPQCLQKSVASLSENNSVSANN